MFLDDSLGVLGRYILIPRAFWINHRNRPSRADPQTTTLGAIARAIGAGNIQLLHPLFDIFPGLLA